VWSQRFALEPVYEFHARVTICHRDEPNVMHDD
jgi:hypothetical protein